MEVVSELSKAAEDKIHTQKINGISILAMSNPQKEIKIIPLIVTSERIKYLWINLNKEVGIRLVHWKLKTLSKEIKDLKKLEKHPMIVD